MRLFVYSLMPLVMLSVFSSRASAALGDPYTLNGATYRSDKPVQETLQFGEVKSVVQRSSIYIPLSYGKLVSITPKKDRSVFWFEDDNGAIRNVLLNSDDLVLIERKGTAAATKE